MASFDSGVTYKGAVGLASIEENLPITTKSVFNIASVSKQFTAFSILLLEQEGRLSLDDSIVKFVPSIGTYAEPVTLRHLIHHTGGLVDYMELAHAENIEFTDILTVEQSLKHLNGHQIARFLLAQNLSIAIQDIFIVIGGREGKREVFTSVCKRTYF